MTRIELFKTDAKFIVFAIPILVALMFMVGAFGGARLVVLVGCEVLAFAPVFLPVYRAALRARGKHVELNEDSIALFSLDHELWRLSWNRVTGIEFSGNLGIDLITRDEANYSIPVFDQKGQLRQTLISHLPADGFVRRSQPAYKVPPLLGWLLAAIGVGLLCWSVPTLIHYMALTRQLNETGDSAIEAELSKFPMGVAFIGLIFGIGLTLVGLLDRLTPRRAPKTTPIASDPTLSLKISLRDAGGKLEHLQPGTFVGSGSAHSQIRMDLVGCYVTAIFFTSIMTGCFVGAIVTHQAVWAGLGTPYIFFVWMGVAGIMLSRRERNPAGWQIKVSNGEIWALSPDGTKHGVLLKKFFHDRYLCVLDLEGNNLFSPKYFLMELDERPANNS